MSADDYARDIAADLMLDAARSVSRSEVKNAAGGHEALEGLTDDEYEAFLDNVLDLIETADIEIDIQGA
jgi:hypothetical protein